ncbi:LysR family transcriptional regulator ArgP [Leeia aquatica]|uniref:LysR family transcriptional regulator ArgP n=1 Tax=Leeia aquatica TaxID=2725557 RepID=A0A847S4X3_9NEIS|nr:LysR family transcriptional regulator ArgP [Leeia aquatica]NLR74177.1 LysR family transcriptional regulator ArgP [Leeia aquatica]
MQLDQKQCEAFRVAIERGSLEQAATALHVTPSAISQRIRALEASLGRPLLVRSRPCRATPDGQALLQYVQRAALLEADLVARFTEGEEALLTVPVAVNADSVASWFLPAVAPFLIAQRVLLDVTVDDQDHTYQLLQAGLALGCISTEAQPMRGCVAEPLGVMRYRAMASADFMQRWFPDGVSRERLRHAPVMVFNRKDRLQADFLQQHFGLSDQAWPRHYLPASEPFLQAVRLGLGWGMLPEVQVGGLADCNGLHDLLPAHPVDVGLYWHSWKVQSPRLEHLSRTLVQAGQRMLRPL